MHFIIKHDKLNGYWVIYNSKGKAIEAQKTKELAQFVLKALIKGD